MVIVKHPRTLYGGGPVTEVEDLARKKNDDKPVLPISGSRSSVSDDNQTLAGFIADMGVSMPEFPFEFLTALDHLGKWHNDVSYAADNIVQLGSTRWNIYFNEEVPEAITKKAIAHLKKREKKWYNYGEGMNSLIGDLLWQVVISGALSSEMIPQKDLMGIQRLVLVHPKKIRFKYNKETDLYDAYQQVTQAVDVDSALKKLNPVTYKYFALRRSHDKPYAVPPFLSAVDPIHLGKELMGNLKYIAKKFGAMGFVEILVNAPVRIQGESETTYTARCEDYLKTVIPRLEKGIQRGYVAGFRESHEFKFNSTTSGNAVNAQKLFEMNDVATSSGLKQDPSMLGRNFSTTETLGRVILAKLTTQVRSYQNLVAAYMSEVYLTELQLAEFPIEQVTVEFDAPMLGDQEKEENAFGLKIKNAEMLFNAGIINQVQRANMLGYDEPDQEEPRLVQTPVSPTELDPKTGKPIPKTGTDPAKEKKTNLTRANVEGAAFELHQGYPEFNYTLGCGHTHNLVHQFDREEDLDKFVRAYFRQTHQVYSDAVAKSVKRIANRLADLGENATLQNAQDRTLFELFTAWDKNFKRPQSKVTEKWVRQVYRHFRKEESVFGGKKKAGEKVPKAVFDVKDTRAMEYLKNSDGMYMGRFITDDDTKRRLLEFIREEYLENGLPIGGNRGKIGAFEHALGEKLMGEEWKIERVIATTLNKARNYAGVMYMDQAGVEQFEIRGVNDRLQCKYCSHMQGRTFSLKIALDKVVEETKSTPAGVSTVAPFVTSVWKDPEVMAKLSDDEIQQAGIDTPPFHPFCRDQVVAIL